MSKRKPNMVLLEDLREFIGNHLADIAEVIVLASKELSVPDGDLITVKP
jgi:hypothetical protein